MLQPPFLSAFDPLSASEGSIDPLGLAATYERLADRILPGVTVRMGRPRFLTALAVGAYVCGEFDADTVAKDGVTPPYLVYEWWIVEGFVRASDQLKETGGIPGIQKVQACYRNSRPVSAPAYLKTASVFGFTGIFRRLARHVGIITSGGLLDEAGDQLLGVWERDQGLQGFRHDRAGDGARFRDELKKATQRGLDLGHTEHRPGNFWATIARHLDPARPGRREQACLRDLLEARAGDPGEVGYLSQVLRKGGETLDFADEARFLRTCRRKAPASLAAALDAINDYEALCRPLTDTFDWIRFLASQEPSRGTDAAHFLKLAPAGTLLTQLKEAVSAASENAALAEHWPDRAEVLTRLREIKSSKAMLPIVVDHHRQAQQRKPPDGKLPWLEEARNRLLVRAPYRLEEPPAPISDYVHEYRLPTFSRFLRDLGAFR